MSVYLEPGTINGNDFKRAVYLSAPQKPLKN